ncbi:hypothetical protein [Devosia alba]|uniref:hypothetical protein n=1 Tax=Devosia alba TaxID=3152360 RepID=UPI003267E18D
MTGFNKDVIAKVARDGEIARAKKAREIALELRRVDKIDQDHVNSLSNLEGQLPVFLETLRYGRLERWYLKMLRHHGVISMVLVGRACLIGASAVVAAMLAADVAGWLR